jgi:hypothetical protein
MAQRKSVSDRGNWGFFLCSSAFVMELKRAIGYVLRQLSAREHPYTCGRSSFLTRMI